MKKLEIKQDTIHSEIDWGKPQWVINETQTLVILTTGQHDGIMFSGTVMPCHDYPNGEYGEDWYKHIFIPITFDIQFTISNED